MKIIMRVIVVLCYSFSIGKSIFTASAATLFRAPTQYSWTGKGIGIESSIKGYKIRNIGTPVGSVTYVNRFPDWISKEGEDPISLHIATNTSSSARSHTLRISYYESLQAFNWESFSDEDINIVQYAAPDIS